MEPRETKDQAVRDAKRGLILDAARRVFADKGFHQARLEDIGEAAGFSKASLYNYYPDKETIFVNLAVREHERTLVQMERSANTDGSALVRLERIIRTIFDVLGEHFAFLLAVSDFQTVCLLHQNLRKPDGQSIPDLQKWTEKVNRVFCRVLDEGRKNHEFASPVEDSWVARYIGALIRGTVMEWKRNRKMGNREEDLQRIMKFLFAGLGVKGTK